VHFSVQGNHVHLLVEAGSRSALVRGLQGLAIRMARAVNWKKHALRGSGSGTDPCSSAAWSRGWAQPVTRPRTPSPVARPRTWLLAVGGRRYGPLDVGMQPAQHDARGGS
jgi:hypothetical protein